MSIQFDAPDNFSHLFICQRAVIAKKIKIHVLTFAVIQLLQVNLKKLLLLTNDYNYKYSVSHKYRMMWRIFHFVKLSGLRLIKVKRAIIYIFTINALLKLLLSKNLCFTTIFYLILGIKMLFEATVQYVRTLYKVYVFV